MNIAGYLSDLPKGFEMYKSLMDNSSAKKGDSVIKSKVHGIEVSVSEQDIYDVLLFGDAADDPTEYSKEKVMDILVKMSYEGVTPPPTIKKLLHPYWRLLAHIYLVCISGNKSGLEKLTLK
ncbi:hypothetical protein Hanom_Chr06g00552901 [Helianthus anomalus]